TRSPCARPRGPRAMAGTAGSSFEPRRSLVRRSGLYACRAQLVKEELQVGGGDLRRRTVAAEDGVVERLEGGEQPRSGYLEVEPGAEDSGLHAAPEERRDLADGVDRV